MPEITLALLRAVAHLPPEKAAHELNVGNTRFKAAIRQLGMAAWPYRKIKSIRNLMNVIQQNPELLGDTAEERLQELQLYEELVFQNPDMPLDDTFRRFRQSAYRVTLANGRRPASGNGRCPALAPASVPAPALAPEEPEDPQTWTLASSDAENAETDSDSESESDSGSDS